MLLIFSILDNLEESHFIYKTKGSSTPSTDLLVSNRESDGLGLLFALPQQKVSGCVVVVIPLGKHLVHHFARLTDRHGHFSHALVIQLLRLIHALPLHKHTKKVSIWCTKFSGREMFRIHIPGRHNLDCSLSAPMDERAIEWRLCGVWGLLVAAGLAFQYLTHSAILASRTLRSETKERREIQCQ